MGLVPDSLMIAGTAESLTEGLVMVPVAAGAVLLPNAVAYGRAAPAAPENHKLEVLVVGDGAAVGGLVAAILVYHRRHHQPMAESHALLFCLCPASSLNLVGLHFAHIFGSAVSSVLQGGVGYGEAD